jgi:hypothetical protein
VVSAVLCAVVCASGVVRWLSGWGGLVSGVVNGGGGVLGVGLVGCGVVRLGGAGPGGLGGG